MCGIFGMVSLTGEPLRFPELADEMGARLMRRGPDAHVVERSSDVIFGQERLRIHDLSDNGDQPFINQNVWLVCNGEIYNSPAIRKRFSDYPYRSASDVEPLLPLYRSDGIAAIDQLDGMFGIAIWDERERRLILARDRAGEKPLFYFRIGNELWFASEIQSLLVHPELPRDLDRSSLLEYLRLGHVSEPRTMFHAIERVGSGSIVSFTGRKKEIHRYWRPETFKQTGDGTHNVATLRKLLDDAVGKQVSADVPVGVFLSGGLDSSLIAKLAANHVRQDQLFTFSARFTEASFDEGSVIDDVARSVRSEHVNVIANEKRLLEAYDAVTHSFAEPVPDPAVLPTYLLAEAARSTTTVILTGEGADELFGGYPTYLGHLWARRYARLSPSMRNAVRRAVGMLPSSTKKVTLEFLLKSFIGAAEKPWFERHLNWFGTRLPLDREPVVPEDLGDDAQMTDAEVLRRVMLFDYTHYLRDNLLVKLDRTAMLHSLESRAPFLDRFLTEFAMTTPPTLNVTKFASKKMLKTAAEAWLPKSVIYRRKRGLSVPVAGMLNGALASELDAAIADERMKAIGIDRRELSRIVMEHRSGRANHARSLWPILILHRWMERWSVTVPAAITHTSVAGQQ